MKFIKRMIKDPCKTCLVQPTCKIYGYQLPYHLRQSCEAYEKYQRKIDKIEDIDLRVTDTFFIGLTLLFFIYIVSTFIFGIVYEIKLIF